MAPTEPLLSIRNLTVRFGDFVAVDNVSFDVREGEIVAIVGESGSGKSVTGLSIIGLVEFASSAEIASGEILLRRADGSQIDLVGQSESAMREIRGSAVSMIFQEPMTSLNPLYTIGNQMSEAVRLHDGVRTKAARARSVEMFERVMIPEPRRALDLYPDQLSGGMRQRVMIAMALSCNPKLLIADEPTSAIDVTIQAQILALLRQLQQDLGLAVILITHDMGVVAEVADAVVVMNRARVLETGSVFDVFEFPQHRYTEHLLAAIPRLGSMVGTTEPAPFEINPQARH